jgi:two-component system LytT family sensor kinase
MLLPSGLFRKFRKYGLHHLFFWVFYVAFWLVITYNEEVPFFNRLLNVSIPIVFHAVVAYFNIYFLVPVLLKKKKYFSFSVALLLSITLVCFPLMYLLYQLNREIAGGFFWNIKFFFLNAVSASYTVMIVTALKLFFDWYKTENQTRQLVALQTETELKYLKSQIHPHFLFNSLNNLYALSLKKSDQTPEVILQLSEILRYVLYEAGEKKVSLDKEVSYLKNYLEIERLRMGERVKIEMSVSGNFDSYEIEPMLLIPFIENAFKHGPGLNPGPGFIYIRMILDNNEFIFSVENNVSDKKLVYANDSSGGIGLANVKKRLDLLYSSGYELTLNESEGVFSVLLKLKLQ